VCPTGHRNVAVIPIVYGDGLSEEDTKRLERHEIALGGCVKEKGAPETSIRCKTCQFVYDAAQRSWQRGSEDPDSFHPAISEFLREFTIPEPWSRGYSQTLFRNGEIQEVVSFVARGSTAKNEAFLSGWSAAHGGDLVSRKEPELQKILFAVWRSRNGAWELELAGDSDSDSFVTLKHSVKKANQALLPTSTVVMPAADAPVTPTAAAADL
jgi:hypothetical protein